MSAAKQRAVQTKRQTKAQRADMYRALYLALGEDRSLRLLREYCGSVGVPVPAKSTLELYSRQYGWVASAKEFDDRQPEAPATTEVFRMAMDMDSRHAKIGQAMQAAGASALGPMKDTLTPASVVALLRDGVKIERLASGKATERVEFTIDNMNALMGLVVVELQNALALLAEHAPPELIEQVMAQFAVAVDDGAARLLAQAGLETRRQVELDEE